MRVQAVAQAAIRAQAALLMQMVMVMQVQAAVRALVDQVETFGPLFPAQVITHGLPVALAAVFLSMGKEAMAQAAL
jgi:hypothetical protein